MIKNIYLLFFFTSLFSVQAQVTLSTDFTNESHKKAILHNIWNVANRISPTEGSNVRSDLKMNIVRMIGGINKKENGSIVKHLEFDPCLYDSIQNTYNYNWEPLIHRLDKIVNSQTEILQIVLDQPPWAFQHGYTFIPTGTRDSIHFRADEQVTHYGNSLPPADKQAYHDFIKALITKLIDTYGEEQVLSWRFRVGSEIETPDHWRGTQQDFIDHFANTEQAVRAVLPNAKVGLHTRIPGFLYKEGTVLNYKGEPFASFTNDLIRYCYDNNVRYDFWGISDYVIIGNNKHRQMSEKYEVLFAPLTEHPKWNTNATLDIMEYATVTTMTGNDGTGFINCATSHAEIVELYFSNLFYKNIDKGLEYIYRWGNRTGSENPPAISVLNSMQGEVRYKTEISGKPLQSNNELDAIFAKQEDDMGYDVLVYNFNEESLDYNKEEPVTLSFYTDLNVGDQLYYRSVSYGKDNNKFQNFLKNEPESGWVKPGFDRNGDPNQILNEEGLEAYKLYVNPNEYQYTTWTKISTKKNKVGRKGSIVSISTELQSFAFQKFEFRKSITQD